MNIDLLKTFLEIARTRHFGRAANNLNLTQSAVSFRIKQLEGVLGTALFSRERNNILLTAGGERFLPHAENILASWHLALQDVGMPEAQDVQLALGGSSNLWDTFLQSILPKLANAISGLYIRTEVNTSQELTRSLLGGRLDVVVTLDPPGLKELDAIKIGRIELLLVSSQNNLALDDIPATGLIYVDWGTAFNFQQARIFETAVAPILHTGQSHIALEFLLSHGGTAFLPKALIVPYLESGHLYLVRKIEPISREVYAVCSKLSPRQVEIQPIIDLLQALELKPSDPFTEN